MPTVAAATIRQLVIWKDTGVDATSPLVLFLDTGGDTAPLAVVTYGAAVTISWPNGGTRIGAI